MCTKNLVILAKDDLYEAFGMATAYSLAIRCPREALDTHIGILLFCLGLCQTDKRNLREGIDGVGAHVGIHLRFMAPGVFGRHFPLGRGDLSAPCSRRQVAERLD